MITLLSADAIKKGAKKNEACCTLKSGEHDEVREGATSGKGVQTSGALYFSANEKYEQSAVPEEIGRAGGVSFLSESRNDSERNVLAWGREKTAVQMRRKFSAPSRFPLDVAAPVLLTASPLAFTSPVASRISSRAFPPRSHQLPARGREKLERQVGRGELVSFPRVTNHLSRRARFRSAPKRGER